MPSWGNNLFLATMLVASTALATPPRQGWITDRLFAENDDVVLVLREIGDNHGSHFTTQTDTILLTISRSDGAITDVALVERVVDVDLGETDTDKTTFTELDAPANPYDVRAARQAAPLNDPRPSTYRTAQWQPTGLTVQADAVATHHIDSQTLNAQIMQSVAQSRAAWPGFDTLADDDVLQVDTLNIEHDCTPDLVYTQWHSSGAVPALVRLHCVHNDTDETFVLWVTVPVIDAAVR